MRVFTDRQEFDRQVSLLEPSSDKILEKNILHTNVFNFGWIEVHLFSLDSAFTEASTYRVNSTVKSTVSHSITN